MTPNRTIRHVVVLTLCLTACPTPSFPELGGACAQEAAGACDGTAARLLTCRARVWEVYSDCFGPGGCAVASDTVSCDTSGNSAGARCPATSEGKLRCDPDGGARILQCVDGGFVSIYDCPEAALCSFIADSGMTCR